MKKTKLEISLLAILLLFIGVVTGFLIGQGQNNRFLQLRPSPRHQAWTISDLPRIQTWLTFDYLNFVFRLPPTYLESKLPAPDTHYPNISIESYAEKHQLDKTKFLESTRTNIRDYFSITASSTNVATST